MKTAGGSQRPPVGHHCGSPALDRGPPASAALGEGTRRGPWQPGSSPLLGQAEARLPVAALTEVEEPADHPMRLLEQQFQAGSQLLVAVLKAGVHGPELGDGRGVQEPVVR